MTFKLYRVPVIDSNPFFNLIPNVDFFLCSVVNIVGLSSRKSDTVPATADTLLKYLVDPRLGAGSEEHERTLVSLLPHPTRHHHKAPVMDTEGHEVILYKLITRFRPFLGTV